MPFHQTRSDSFWLSPTTGRPKVVKRFYLQSQAKTRITTQCVTSCLKSRLKGLLSSLQSNSSQQLSKIVSEAQVCLLELVALFSFLYVCLAEPSTQNNIYKKHPKTKSNERFADFRYILGTQVLHSYNWDQHIVTDVDSH